MSLQEIKREVHSLPSIKENHDSFKKHWVKPIRANTNQHLPFLNQLSAEAKKELNSLLEQANVHLSEIKNSQVIHDKLQAYSRQLIELKLSTLQNNQHKTRQITNQLLYDDFMNLKKTIKDIKDYKLNTQKLSQHYEAINSLLHRELSLEESLFFMDMPHKIYLYNLVKTAQSHERIVRDLGLQFVDIVKEAKTKRKQK